MTDRDFEQEARSEGWVPIDEWKGDPEKHVDAETFVKRGEEILPIVNAKNRRLMETVEELQGKVNELSEGNKEFKQFHSQAMERAKQESAQLRQQLEEQRRQAIENSDGKAFDAADKQLRDLDAQEKTQSEEQRLPPHTMAWLEDNPWYTSDRGLKAMADGFSDELAKSRPDLLGKREFLDELTKMVREERPDKFENPKRDDAPVNGETKKTPVKTDGRTFDDLPEDAQQAAIRFEKTHGLSREQYVAEYPWD